MSLQFVLNDTEISTQANPGMVVLDYLRRERRLTATKEGCREGDCGACMVLLGRLQDRDSVAYRAVNSCLLPLGDVQGKHLVTLEGLNGPDLNPIQQAFVDHGASQCGFCTPGFIVSLVGYCLSAVNRDPDEAFRAVAGNICRCTGYSAIRRAIRDLLKQLDQPAMAIVPDYFKTIPQRLQALTAAALTGGSGVPVAGGTDLFVQRPDQLLAEPLEFLSDRQDLSGVRIDEDHCWIGAATPVEDLKELRCLLPGFEQTLGLIASAPIRNRATVGGNIVNASPIADLAVLLLVLNTMVHLQGQGRQRDVPLKDFFQGYKILDLQKGELVLGFSFPIPAQGFAGRFNFEKVSRRTYLDIASVNSACYIETDTERLGAVRVSAGGVAPVPLLLEDLELTGTAIQAQAVRRAAELAVQAISPISDVRGSAQYKALLFRQLIYAHFLFLFPTLSPGDLL